ncbi:MAG: metal ABC transporter permease [Acidimicrobiia bacterium]|nr:metal ABC transporter permease [Acidimicrobiia bacterium]
MSFVTDPWGWWIEPFTVSDVMVDALIAGLLAVLATSVVGTWVVLRGMSFLGDALAHGVLPGIAVAFIVGVDLSLGAFVAALAMVGGINVIRRHSPLPDDTSIGVLFVGFLALAVLILSSRSSYAGDLTGFLFGSITGIDAADLRRQAIAAAVTVAGIALFYRPLLVMTFDETQARLLGLRPGLAHAVLLGLVAVSIVASFRAVGNLLVFAFLVAPPATAALLVRRVPRMMAASVLVGAGSVLVGLLVSYHHDTAAGASMALAAVVAFLGVVAGQASWQALRSAQ